jgi:CRP/FNR family transcriptional regulator
LPTTGTSATSFSTCFAERIAELMQLVEEVAFHRLDQRLAKLLVARGESIQVTHQALAEELGSVREMVSRLLKGFAVQGLVRLGREQITVIDGAGCSNWRTALADRRWPPAGGAALPP